MEKGVSELTPPPPSEFEKKGFPGVQLVREGEKTVLDFFSYSNFNPELDHFNVSGTGSRSN